MSIVDLSKLDFNDRTLAEDWFMKHECDAAYPDLILHEEYIKKFGMEVIAQCTCGEQLDLTHYWEW